MDGDEPGEVQFGEHFLVGLNKYWQNAGWQRREIGA